MSKNRSSRREFLGTVAVGVAAANAALPGLACAETPGLDAGVVNGLPYRMLGKTGVKVSIVGLGGFHIGKPTDEKDGIALVRSALDRGINFLDNCWDYNNGESERRMGKALQDGYRQKAFLMTKIDGRTKDAAAKQIDESLKRLQTDHVDLLQFHEIIRFEDPDRIFGDNGAYAAVMDAKKAGKLRFVGFTGHKDPEIHLKMLEMAFERGVTFDTVQMPLNVMDAHYHSFEKKVLPVLLKHQIGVLGMKSMGDGEILKSGAVSAIECLHYAMNLPTSVVITGCERMEILDQAIQAAKTFKPLSKAQVSALLAKTEKAGKTGKFELSKTTNEKDGTAKHIEWLG